MKNARQIPRFCILAFVQFLFNHLYHRLRHKIYTVGPAAVSEATHVLHGAARPRSLVSSRGISPSCTFLYTGAVQLKYSGSHIGTSDFSSSNIKTLLK